MNSEIAKLIHQSIHQSIKFKLGFPVELEWEVPTTMGGIVRIEKGDSIDIHQTLYKSSQLISNDPIHSQSYASLDEAKIAAEDKALALVQERFTSKEFIVEDSDANAKGYTMREETNKIYQISPQFAAQKVEFPIFLINKKTGQFLQAYFQGSAYDWADIEAGANMKPSNSDGCNIL